MVGRDDSNASRSIAIVRPTLRGRDRELAILLALVDGAREGRGGVALVGGEPGIGKTRLVEELITRAEDAAVGMASCAVGDSPPFWTWRRAVADGVARAAGHTNATVLDDSLEALELTGSASVEGSAAAEFRDRRLDQLERVRAVLRRLDRGLPVVLVLDDLQWSDAGTLALLATLRPDCANLPLVVVGTFRSGELGPDHGLRPLLARQGGDIQRIRLGGLPVTDVGELAASFRGGSIDGIDPAALHDASGGNPLFVREIARLHSASPPPPQNGSAREPFELPDTVRAVIGQRLDRLSQSSRTLLDAAAVVGRQLPLELLVDVVGVHPSKALESLDELQRDGLVAVGDEPGMWGFTHALIRQSAYEALGARRRAELHLAYATSLERHRDPVAHAAELAYHFRSAIPLVPAGDAARHCAVAGRQALDALAYEDAARLLRQALELEPPHDPVEHSDLLLAAGEAELRSGHRDQAAAAFERAAELALVSGRTDHLALAALGLGAGPSGFEIMPFDDRQLELLEAALAAMPEDDSPLRARVLARLSVASTFLTEASRRLDLATEAVAMARRLDSPSVLAYALSAHCDTVAGPDHIDVRLEQATEMLALSSRSHDREMELLARRLRIVAHLERGDVASFDADVAAFERVAERLRLPLYSWYVPLWRATRAMMAGDHAEAERLHTVAADLGRKGASYNADLLTHVARSNRLLLSGENAEFGRAQRLLLDHYPEMLRLPGTLLTFAFFEALSGERASALRFYERASPVDLDEINVDGEWLGVMAYVGGAYVELSDRHGAAAVYERLLPYSELFIVDGIAAGFLGSVHGWLAPLADLLELDEAARRHRDAAVAANLRVGATDLARRLEIDGRPWPPARAGDGSPGPGRSSGRASIAGDRNTLRRDGDLWSFTYDGSSVMVKASKGIGDLALLLGRPGTELAAVDLVTPGGAPADSTSGELLDARARREYRERIEDLQDDLDEASAANDLERAARAQAELDLLLAELAAATGLGGRPRRAGSDVERARKAVSGRIADALRRLDSLHPSLARHLRSSIHTGTFCSYRPERPTEWHVDPA